MNPGHARVAVAVLISSAGWSSGWAFDGRREIRGLVETLTSATSTPYETRYFRDLRLNRAEVAWTERLARGIYARGSLGVSDEMDRDVSGNHVIKDAFLAFRAGKRVVIKAGRMPVPVGSEAGVSADDLPFSERTSGFYLVPGRGQGLQVEIAGRGYQYRARVFNSAMGNTRDGLVRAPLRGAPYGQRLEVTPVRWLQLGGGLWRGAGRSRREDRVTFDLGVRFGLPDSQDRSLGFHAEYVAAGGLDGRWHDEDLPKVTGRNLSWNITATMMERLSQVWALHLAYQAEFLTFRGDDRISAQTVSESRATDFGTARVDLRHKSGFGPFAEFARTTGTFSTFDRGMLIETVPSRTWTIRAGARWAFDHVWPVR